MNKEIGLDLTKTTIIKFDQYVVEKLEMIEEIDNEELKKITSNIGLDLVNNKVGYKIDISKYEKNIK
jgi:hypothetical protein